MKYASLDDFLKQGQKALAKEPVALIFVEDDVELDTTARHHLDCGFASVLMLMPDAFDLPDDLAEKIHRIPYDCSRKNAIPSAVNAINDAAEGIWLYYCYNAEFLFYPFIETRTIGEMLGCHSEERREAMLTYVIDLYAGDLDKNPTAVSLEAAYLDKSGYYAQGRTDPITRHPKERQLDFFGGLRWRYEEHIPKTSRKIDRIALFRAAKGLKLRPDHTFENQEYNTYSCPWHNNLTATICSFRTAKALKRNPGSSFSIDSFRWHNSTPFDWHSRQLMDLGLMEPGQWF
ncbi:MAG: hypothetical protein ACI92Z_002291 [Paracoccaceae bacterium]|jgi:hypothetical protein